MKSIIKYLFALSVAFGSTSCSDFLEKPILGTESLDTYFQTQEECEKYVVGTYEYMVSTGWSPVYVWWIISDMATDDGWMGNTQQTVSYPNFQPIAHYLGGSDATTNTYMTSFWEQRYRGINSANIGVEYIGDAEVLDEQERTQYLAEMKFMRAFLYFDLVRNFGGVPIVLHQLTVSESREVSRSSASEVYAQIESDLQYAIDHLDYKADVDYANNRANRGMAEALLAKAYIYQEKFSDAYDTAVSVINNGGYTLEANFGDVWSKSDNSTEAIIEIQTSDSQDYALGNPCPVVTGHRSDSGWSWGVPTSHLEEAFTDAGDDIRKKYTIIKGGDAVEGDASATTSAWDAAKNKSNRIIRKFYIPKADRTTPYNNSYNKLNHHVLRLADVILIAAEAAYESGDETNAKIYLNQIRDRVDLSAVTSTGDDLRDAIRLERRLELAFEHSRLYDMRRWKMDDGRSMLSNAMGSTGYFVQYNKTSTDEFESTNVIEPSTKGSTFVDSRDNLFPIPNTEVVQSGGVIEQNPGF